MTQPEDSLSPAVRARRWVLDRTGTLGRSVRASRARAAEHAQQRDAEVKQREAALQQREAALDQFAGQHAQLAAQHAQLAERIEQLAEQLSGIHRGVQHTQALATRAYERSFAWDRVIEEQRDTDAYAAAYEPEPLVTVRIATYNRSRLLVERALASVQRQTYPNWEAIVVGDHCTDDTAERIAALGDDRIRFENLPYRGPYPEDEYDLWMVAGTWTVAVAFDLARGSWIAPLDDDDEWDDDHLEVMVAEALRTRAEFLYAKWRIRDAASGRLLGVEAGAWPPRHSRVAMQSSLEHSALRRCLPDINAYLADEPGDWHRVRRLWDAGARFAFLDRAVTTVWYQPRHAQAERMYAAAAEAAGYSDEPGQSGSPA